MNKPDAVVARLLRDALRLLQRHGWGQHFYEPATGGYCAIGALIAAAGWKRQFRQGIDLPPPLRRALAALCRTLQLSITSHSALALCRPLSRWNDTPGRTAREVVRLYRRTLAQWRH